MSAILPPDSPEDCWPVPYERRKVEKALPLAKNQTASLKGVGVKTMADFDLWLARGNALRSLAGIGPLTETKILEAHAALRATVDVVEAARKASGGNGG